MTGTRIRAGVIALLIAATVAVWDAGASAATPIKPDASASVTAKRARVTVAGIQLRNQSSWLCLTARAGSGERPAVQTTCDYNAGASWPDQYWQYIYPTGQPGVVRIRNTHLGLCLAARGSGESGAFATTCGSGTNWPDQIWRLEYVAQWNADRIKNSASGLCLAARGSTESRAIVTTCNYNWPDQHWF